MLYILKSNRKLAEHDKLIKVIAVPVIKHAAKLLQINTAFDIVVSPYKAFSDDFTVSGYTTDMPNSTCLFLNIDPTRKNLVKVIKKQLPPVLAHEMHHLRRMAGPGYGGTPRETIVTEALAARFEDEACGTGMPSYCKGTPAEIRKLWKEWEPRLDKPCGYEYWFEGKTKSLSPAARYVLGYALTEDLSKKPSELVLVPAKEILLQL